MMGHVATMKSVVMGLMALAAIVENVGAQEQPTTAQRQAGMMQSASPISPTILARSVSSISVPAPTSTPPTTPSAPLAPNFTPNSSQPALTLEDSIRLALRNHGNIGAAEQGFVSARQGIVSARSGYFPQVTGDINYDYRNTRTSRTTAIVTPGGGTSTSSRTSVTSNTTTGVNVSQNIFDSGRTRLQVRQANARALGAVGGVGSARSGLAFVVAQNFFEQLRQEKLVTQRQGQVELARQQLEQIQAQVEAGVSARVDVQSVQVNLSQARFDLATARNDLRVAETNFRNILGLGRGPALVLQETPLAVEVTTTPAPASTVEEIPPAPGVTPPPPFPTAEAPPLPIVPALDSLEAYLAEARRLRPDLLQARASVQQSETIVSLAQIEARPQITANAGYNIDPRSTQDRGFTFGAGVSVPIFDAGGRRADVRAARADLEANRIQLAQLDKDVAADVEAAFVDIGGEVERVANARALVESARTNLETATERYRLGLGIVLDIVNAQTQLFNAQTSLTQAVYDYELARSNLDRAVGRFAWANPGQPVPQTAPTTVPRSISVTAPRNNR